MTYLASFSLGAGSVNPTPAGVEMDWTRRLIDFTDLSYGRLCYGGGGVGDVAMGVSFSTDAATSWAELIPTGPTLGTAGALVATPWVRLDQMASLGDVWVAARAYGSTLLGLYAVKFLDLQLR